MDTFRDLISKDLSFRILSQIKVEHGSRFMPDSFQLFPGRYIAPNTGRLTICIDYDMGTGKTLSASLAIKDMIANTIRIENELRRSGNAGLIGRLPRPYVIGNWSTIDAFEVELARPIFGILSEQEYADFIAIDGSEKRHMALSRRIRSYVRMASYQRMFNRYFKGSSDIAIKSEQALLAAIERKDVTIDNDIILELSDSILIVDETQMLYSSHGWNTYGILLDHIRQNTAIRNLTTILLSGTFVNSSPVEIVHLYNLIRDRGTPRVSMETFFERKLIGEQSYSFESIETKEEALISLYDGKVASYRISPSKDFPKQILVGEAVGVAAQGGATTKLEWLRVTRCHASQYQWSQYNAESSRNVASGSTQADDEDDEESDMMDRDFVLPAKEEWKDYHVEPVRGSSEVYRGTWLTKKNLAEKFGAIPAVLIELLHGIISGKTGEKVVAHHRRLDRGGLMQYAEALKENGLTLLDDNPRDDAICILCGATMIHHSSNVMPPHPVLLSEARIDGDAINIRQHGAGAKEVTGHKFVPATFAMLTGRSAFTERQRTLNIYNSSSNLFNQRIMCLLISGVGEKGITLKATNYAVALDVFPGIPAWRQFISRVARHATHVNLPEDKRWAKIMTMVLSSPSGSKELSRDEFRYIIKESNDRISGRLWNMVRLRSVNCPLIPRENRGTWNIGMTASDAAIGAEAQLSKRGAFECQWNFGKEEISHQSFDTYYHIAHVSYVKDVIRRCWEDSPIWPLGKLTRTIISDVVRNVPHNMSYTSETAICEAIVDMCVGGTCQLYSEGKQRDLSALSPAMLEKDDIIVIAGAQHRGPLPLTIFTSHAFHHGSSATWISITGSSDVGEFQRVVNEIASIHGQREKIVLFDRIVGKPGLEEVMHKDFEMEGPLYKLLRKTGGIVWKGDDESHRLFAANRLRMIETQLSKRETLEGVQSKTASSNPAQLKPIGFIIGNEYHSVKGSKWSKNVLPLFDMSNTEQWTICAIFSPGTATMHGRWHTRTKIRPLPSDVKDLRKAQSGMACISLQPKQVAEYMELLKIKDQSDKKLDKCELIEEALLRRQLTAEGTRIRFIYTPFESPPTWKK